MTSAVYNILTLDLTTAGSETVDGPFAICRFLDAEDSSGAIDPSAKVTVRAERGADQAPLRLGQAMLAVATRRFIIEWEAQSGVTAVFGFSNDPQALDWDADPPARLVTGDKGSAVENAAVTVGTTAELLDAADGNRRALTIQNLGAADIYVGDSDVTTANGVKVASGGTYVLTENTAAVYGRSGTAGQDVRVLAEAS